MPAMVKLAANPNYKATTQEDDLVYKEIKKKGAVLVDYVTAMENVANSRGMYAVVPESGQPQKAEPRRIEDMTGEELKVTMLSLGIKTEKQMKRVDVIRLIQSKLAEIDIVDGGE